MSSNSSGGIRKRRRKVWSCAECRRRKLQCDRAQPTCSRCVASGSLCSYTGDPFASEKTNANVSHRTISAASNLSLGRNVGFEIFPVIPIHEFFHFVQVVLVRTTVRKLANPHTDHLLGLGQLVTLLRPLSNQRMCYTQSKLYTTNLSRHLALKLTWRS